jgi:hypothetical protein
METAWRGTDAALHAICVSSGSWQYRAATLWLLLTALWQLIKSAS